MNPFDLTDRVAIVTGGSAGIGRGIALGLARAGANVVVAARRQDRIDAVCTAIRAEGGHALGVVTVVTSPAGIDQLVTATLAEFGRIDVLVNNAGASYGDGFRRGPLADLAMADFDGCFALNTRSVFLAARAANAVMQRQGKGAIINIGSVGGQAGRAPQLGFALYGAAKAATIHLTVSMAAEWGPAVRVNSLLPGVIETERSASVRSADEAAGLSAQVAMGRIGAPQDVAGAAVFLASDAAAFVTGASLAVDGGTRSVDRSKLRRPAG